jgi:uncharacterized membrane protein YcjF (UPF0283 family)
MISTMSRDDKNVTQGFPALVIRAWVWGRRLLIAGLALVAGIVVLNGIQLYDLLAGVHVWLARGTFLVLGVVFVGLAIRAGWLYLRAPRVLTAPDLPPVEERWTAAQVESYRRFAVRYLRRQSRNRHLDQEHRAKIPAALEAIAAAPGEPEAAMALRQLVDGHVDEVLAPIDALVSVQIRRTAVQVATATAVSPSVMLDSMITFSRNLDLIARIADLYYGRPGLWGTLRVARDVIGSAVTAGALELVSEHISAALAEMTGSWSARLIGPLGQGMVNGVVTMRFGAAARFRCRTLSRRKVPWRPWQLAQYRRAFGTLTRWITDEAGPGALGPLSRFAGWTGKATEKTVAGGRRIVDRVRDRLGSGGATAQPPQTLPEPTDDPLLDSSLMS